ncbi:MAG: glycerol-3-phosphate 1-O-acyltransferase PlsB [Dokdonella sp.]
MPEPRDAEHGSDSRQQSLPLHRAPDASAAVPIWLKLFGAVNRPWIRIRREPKDPLELLGSDEVPTVYVVERHGLSDTLILDQACHEAGLPSPYEAASQLPMKRTRASIALTPRPGLFRSRPHPTRSETLTRLAAMVAAGEQRDIRLLPVSIFVGRSPDRQTGWFRVLFAENWVVVGRFRRLLAILLNGRDTLVQFAPPISLREIVDEDLSPERTVRKVSRVLRTHFRRVREVVVGPDLSTRRMLVDSVLAADSVREAIADQARRDKSKLQAAQKKAHAMAYEIAADYSHPMVRSLSFMLTPVWNRIYRGVLVHHLEKFKQAAPGFEVVYVPTHRSHMDYLLLSYLLYTHGVVPPHIFAGINLNLPVVGSILRKGGAFFARRSFKGNALYSAVFREYMAQLIAGGYSIEYFIEGGRSRTGRLLQPKAGSLAMTVRAYLRQPSRPVLFQPVYIGYEKLMEGRSYLDELSGKPKAKESIWHLLMGIPKVLRSNYGQVAVNFGEPIKLNDVLAAHAGWDGAPVAEDEKPAWLSDTIDELAQQIQVSVNRAADINPINLLAMSLLAMPKHAMSEIDLLAQLELLKDLLAALPFSERLTITPLSPAEIIAYAESMQWIRRVQHPLGDVLMAEGDNAVLLSYFRNNVQHVFVAAAWIACCFLNNRRMSRSTILRIGRLIYPFIQAELFLHWTPEEFTSHLRSTLDFFVKRGLLTTDADGRVLERSPGQSDTAFRLRTLSHSLLQAVERYYITIALLVSNGRHTLSAAELENLCFLTAQRLSLLQELNAPEFFDRSLFRGFIQKLRERRVIRADENNKLDFDVALETLVTESKVILSRDIRHGILKLTSKPTEISEPDAASGEQKSE